MDLNFREKKMLQILYVERGVITLEKLASKCGVTKRTILSDIKKIRKFLQNLNIEINSRPGVGVWLTVSEEAYSDFLQLICEENFSNIPIMPEERVIYILKKLMQTDTFLSFETISNEIFVSKTTISNDLEKVEEFLQKYNVSLSKNKKHGTAIEGDEKSLRLAEAELYKLILTKSDIHNDGSSNFLKNIDLSIIEDLLSQLEKKYSITFVDMSKKELIITLGIIINRIKIGKKIELNDNEIRKLKSINEWQQAVFICEELCKSFNIDLCEYEIAYITMHLASSKTGNNFNTVEKTLKSYQEIDPVLYECIVEILKVVSVNKSWEFCEDKKLFSMLFEHLRPTLRRIENNITINNPYLNEIKSEYTYAYVIGIEAALILENFYKIKISDDEVGYIALHFCAAIEKIRTNSRLTALIICATGIGTSNLLFARFSVEFPNVEVYNTASIADVEEICSKRKIDLIISTIPFLVPNFECVQVSPLFNKKDIDALKLSIKNITKKRNSILSTYVDEDLIIIHSKSISKREIIKEMFEAFYKKGFVEEEFEGLIQDRENIFSSHIGNMVSMPHSINDKCVKVPRIGILTLKKPVLWDSNYILVVIMLALSTSCENDYVEIFKNISELVSSIGKVKSLAEITDKDILFYKVSRVSS